jgi:hypothetical protein
MPIVQVFAGHVDDVPTRLGQLCAAVAEAFGLEPADVVATHIPVAHTILPGQPTASWPVVVVHGSGRPADQVRAAEEAIIDVVRRWSGSDSAGTWVTWHLRR